ncbi:GAF domain-containing sensor histidine kinase [Natronosalvus rutilus]|uniref:histidine kinase n=1 Tax=Natronosalvus rutilus TaxID=2953753 RepID=A0A9E7NDP2_9EURY|nr:GAF domain-containing sensor histidine kinase [Natronosalvus rutilus]UTF54832.1 GAF domain-containing sensor histidine kinase [Natronosalvus rutilus]
MTNTTDTFGPDEVRQYLYDVMRQNRPFREKAEQALVIGRDYLGVENGHLTRLDPETNHWEAIASTDPPDGTYPAGLTLDLQTTYCRRTIDNAAPIALHDAPAQGWADDPAFETHGLHCYHGTQVTVGDELFGTICFVSDAPRAEPFSEEKTMFTELLAQMLGHELERAQHEAALTDRERLIGVLNRVLRHNLRNDMTLLRGYAELLQEEGSPQQVDVAEMLLTTTDDLLALSEKARRLDTVVTNDLEYQRVEMGHFLQTIQAEIEAAVPGATISIEGDTDTYIRVAWSMETALREVIENAAKHAGDSPDVSISVRATDGKARLQVMDTGPGLPEQERTVLRDGAETPLEHGSGLGLWLVYWVVTSHGGTIETTVDETGTTVTISFPRTPAHTLPERLPSRKP